MARRSPLLSLAAWAVLLLPAGLPPALAAPIIRPPVEPPMGGGPAYVIHDPKPACLYGFDKVIESEPLTLVSSVPVHAWMVASTSNPPERVPGKSGYALYFNGNGSYATAPDTQVIGLGTDDFSIALWIKTSQSYATLLDKRVSSTKAGYHMVLYNGRLLFQLGNASAMANFWNPSSAALNDNAWHLVAVTVDRDNASGGKLYVDGNVIHTFNPTSLAGSMDNAAPLLLGRHRDNAWPYQGFIDELYITHRALSQAELVGAYRCNGFIMVYSPFRPKGTWLWHASLIESEPDALFDFLTANHVAEIYLQVDPGVDASSYAAFIQRAQAQGISVEALLGEQEWALPAGADALAAAIASVGTFNAENPRTPFSALHLDVEPYKNAEWNAARGQAILDYQNAIASAAEAAWNLGLPFHVDMPFWFDDPENNYSNTHGSGRLSDWVIAMTSATWVMDYRDTADGPNGMIALAATEMATADAYETRLMIAAETNPSSEGDYVTFYEEGAASMNDTLDQVDAFYAPSYDNWGFAIHDLVAWMQLGP
jgi:hypothetical protein